MRRAMVGACSLVALSIAGWAAFGRTPAPARIDSGAASAHRHAPRFTSSGLHYATTRDGARVDVRIDSAEVERREIGPFRIRGFDALRLEGVSVEIEGPGAETIAVAPLLADALRQLPVRDFGRVEVEHLAVAWLSPGRPAIRLTAKGARSTREPGAIELLKPTFETPGARGAIAVDRALRLVAPRGDSPLGNS